VFIQRTEPFIPQPGQTQVPADYIYEAPTLPCDKHTEATALPEDPLAGEENLEDGEITPTPGETNIEPTPTIP
jgi:hypothetical protein